MGAMKSLRKVVENIPSCRTALMKVETIVSDLQRNMCGVSTRDIRSEIDKVVSQTRAIENEMAKASRQTGGRVYNNGLGKESIINSKVNSTNLPANKVDSFGGATPTSGNMLGTVKNGQCQPFGSLLNIYK